jgi:methyl-accepting chemotaxis protein
VGPEYLIALQALRGAWAGIQYCCDALNGGAVEIRQAKKTIEGGVASAKAIYKEVTGIWDWVKGLLGGNPDPKPEPIPASAPATVDAPKAKTKRKSDPEYLDEDAVVQQFIEDLGVWFDAYHELKAIADKAYVEIFSKDVVDQKEVLKLTQLQVELDKAYPDLMSQMTTRAPWQLGPIWSRFNEMQDKVAAKQEARRVQEKRQRAKRAADEAQRRSDEIDRNMTWFWSLTLVFYFWVLMGTVWVSANQMP